MWTLLFNYTCVTLYDLNKLVSHGHDNWKLKYCISDEAVESEARSRKSEELSDSSDSDEQEDDDDIDDVGEWEVDLDDLQEEDNL